MAHTTTTRTRTGLSPFHMASNAIVWISAVIVMGILSYLISLGGEAGSRIIYMEVVAVLTVALFLAAFILSGRHADFFLPFNLIFSYLWLVVVVFTAESWTYSNSALLHAAEAFSFIAFFFLLFNVLYDWHVGYRGRRVHSAHV